MAEHNILGLDGESLAADYLQRKGYAILDRNWRCGHKELDLVARTADTLVIVEVKTRSSLDFGNPCDAVGARKIQRLISAADAYIRKNCLDIDVRFDIVTIIKQGERMQIQHIENAFCPQFECYK